MFVRPSWLPQSDQDVHDLIVQNPWGLIVSNGEDGPQVTNVPWVLASQRGAKGVLISHMSRANEHAKALQAETKPVLAVFHGPSSYITPSWYPGRNMPPTVYYCSAHCYGSLNFQDTAAVHAAVKDLSVRSEKNIPNGWRTDEIPATEITRRLPGILGFELTIERIEAKFKLGQDEPRRDAMAVGERLIKSEDLKDKTLGAMVIRFNEHRAD